jgi:hypothetical protein
VWPSLFLGGVPLVGGAQIISSGVGEQALSPRGDDTRRAPALDSTRHRKVIRNDGQTS